MAQYIKKLLSGGKPESENELKKLEKKLFKTDFGDYDADLIIKSYQSLLNRYADNVGLRGNKREQFITAGYGILDDLKNGNIRREGRKFWGPNMSDGNKEQAWALQLLEDVINKTPVYKGEQESDKPKEKEKFDINGIQKLFINTYYGGNNKADITSWLDRDLADETGKRGNANRIAEFTNMLKAYSESLKDKDLDFEGSAYSDLNDYLSKLNAAIDALNNGTWDNLDAIALDLIGIGKALRNQLFGDGTEEKAPVVKLYRDMTDEEKIQARINEMKTKPENSSYTDEQLAGIATIQLEQEKRDAENKYKLLLDENEWAKQEERYKALNQDVINGYNVHINSDLLYDINDYNDFDDKLKKTYADYYDYLYDLLSELNSPKYSLYYSLLDDVKSNKNTLHNILYHNFNNDGTKTDISRQENINRRKVLGALLYADIQLNGDNPDYYIKNNDDYIIVPTITDNGYAWSFNPKTGSILRINYTSNNEAYNKYLKELFLKKRRLQVSSNKKGGQIISLRKFQNAGKINSTVLNARRLYAKKKALNKNDFYTKKSQETGKTKELIKYENQPIGLNSVDTARAAAIVADITSMLTALLPGGSVVSSIAGLGSTGANAFADINDDSLSFGDASKNFFFNIVGDAAGALPFAGTYFKSAKILRNAARLVPKILTLYNAGQVAFDDNVQNSLKKIVTNGEKLTLEDWRNVATAFSSLAGVTRMSTLELKSRAARNAGKIKTITEPEISIETKNKGTKTLTKELFDKVKNAKTVELAQGIIRGFGGDFADVELNLNHSERNWKNWFRSTPNNNFDQSDFVIKLPETVLDYDDVLRRLGNNSMKANELKALRSVQTGFFDNWDGVKWGNPYSYKKGGQIIKAQNGTLSDLFKKKYDETDLPEWYAKNNYYTQLRLNEWDPGYDMSQSGKLNGYPLHRQQADLKSAYILNNAYTSNHQAVSNDLNNYYKINNNLSAADFVNLYNNNAGKIRGNFEKKTDLTYKNNNWRNHNKLFRQMFNSRSLGEGKNLYDLGYDEPSEDILGSTTWHRRMDRYENEFDKLTDIELKKARVHKIGDGKDAFYVYKKANGDIELLSDEDKASLGLNLPINNPQATNNNSANSSQNATILNPNNNNNNNTRASIDNTEGQSDGEIESGRVEGFNSPEERRANLFGKKLILGMTEIVPDAISAGRFISNLHAKDTNYRTLLNLRVPQKSLKQGNRDVYRSLNIEQEGERQASQLQSLAGKATTSDEAMNYAKLLEALAKASEIKRNTQLQSDLVARQTHELLLARIKELIDYNTNVKDVNTAALVEAYNELLKLKATTRTAKQQDINTYLMEIEQRLRTKQADKKTKQDWLDLQIMSAKASEALRNDPTYQKLLTDYLEAPSGTQKKVDALRALRVWSYEVLQNLLWDLLGQFADANKLDKSQIPVHRSGTKIDDTDVKKRTRDHDRLAKLVLASIRSTERSINNASKSKLLSIKKFLDLWK